MNVKKQYLSILQLKKGDEKKFLFLSKKYLGEILKKKVSKEKNILNYKTIQNNRGKIFWILKRNSKIGFVVIYVNNQLREKKKNCYIRDLYIKENYRLKEFGKIAVSKIIEYALKRKLYFIKIDILNTNKIAIEFWSKLLFKKRGKSYYLNLK